MVYGSKSPQLEYFNTRLAGIQKGDMSVGWKRLQASMEARDVLKTLKQEIESGLVAIEAVDGRKGIDSLARLCQEKLAEDPFSGCVFVFRSRSGTAIRLLSYDGQGYWLAQKRLSRGRFAWWPEASGPAKPLEAYEVQLLMAAGDVSRVRAAPMWRRVSGPK